MKIGSHVANNGDLMLVNSLNEAYEYNSDCFMIYLGPPQSTMRKPFEALNSDLMIEGLKLYHISLDDVIIHAPYICNLAQPDNEKRQFAIDFITSEMKTMAKIGVKYLVCHPGAHMNAGIDKGLELIADSFKQILTNTIKDKTCIAIETMAGKGSECCFQFWQIKKIIDLVGPLNKRIVVCFDTCHTHDSGYDIINNYDGVLNEFDKEIGLDKLKVIHLNDSKNKCGEKKDRHENIGFGEIGFDTLMRFVNDDRFKEIPIILETPYVKSNKNEKITYSPYKREIEMIRSNRFDSNLIDKIINDNE